MSATKISSLIELVGTNLDDLDLFAVVDSSDFTQSGSGSTKKIKRSELFGAIETLLGSNPEGIFTDLTERLAGMDANITARATGLTAHQQATDDTKVTRMRAYNAGTVQSLASGTLAPVSFDTTRYEYPTGQFGGGANPVWTCQEDGIYAGVANVQFSGGTAALTNAYRSVNISKSDTVDIAHVTADAPQGGTVVHPFSVPFENEFVAGDFIRVKAQQNNSGNVAVNISKGTAYSPEFSIHKIGYWQNSNVDTTDTGGTATGGTVFTPLPAPTAWYPTSPFNTPIADLGVTPRTDSAAIVASIFSRGPGNVNINEFVGSGLPSNSNDFSHVVYTAGTADPTYIVHQTSYVNPDVEGATVHIPTGAKPSGGSDFSMDVIQPDGQWEYSFYNVTPPAGGGITCAFARKGRIDQTGLGIVSPDRGGITSARFSLGLGVVRGDEWVADTIDHALFCAVSGWHLRCYPGVASGGTTGQITDTTAPPMGMLLQLNPALNISGCPEWLRRILQAMKDYGMYIGDNGGSTLNFFTESETPYRALGVSPTVQQYLSTVFGHTGTWSLMQAPLATKAAWISNLTAMTAPSP